MSATTVNSFPPVHSFDSPRSWVLAGIILLHVGFFLALSSGLNLKAVILPPNTTVVEFIPEKKPEPKPVEPNEIRVDRLTIPTPTTVLNPVVIEINDPVISAPPTLPTPPVGEGPNTVPIIEGPRVDPRFGLSEPVYPASEIRREHEGTVQLSLQILEDGRVGAVKIVRSSGYAGLDESAAREARHWRFTPGTHDGVPVVMWKDVPIKFELTRAQR